MRFPVAYPIAGALSTVNSVYPFVRGFGAPPVIPGQQLPGGEMYWGGQTIPPIEPYLGIPALDKLGPPYNTHLSPNKDIGEYGLPSGAENLISGLLGGGERGQFTQPGDMTDDEGLRRTIPTPGGVTTPPVGVNPSQLREGPMAGGYPPGGMSSGAVGPQVAPPLPLPAQTVEAQRQRFRQLDEFSPQANIAQMGQQKQGLSNEALMGLLSAGLGILANNTGHYGAFGPPVGRGGQIGLNTYLQQKQLGVENRRRDELAAAESARWEKSAAYQDALIKHMDEKERQDAEIRTQRASIIADLEKATDPIIQRGLIRKLAVLEGKAADVYKADIEKRQKPIKSIEGAGGELRKEVWRDAVTNEVLWEGEPYKAGGQNISMALPPTEKAFDVKYGGAQGEGAVDLEKMADKAHSTLDTTNRLMDFAKRWVTGGGQLGKAANIQAFVSSVMQAGGFDPSALGLPKDAGPAQALTAISNNFVLSKIGGEGGMPANNFSNADREFLQQTKPNIVQTPEGFILVTMIERGAARRAIERDEMLQDELDAFPDDQSEKAYRSFRRKWRQHVKNTSAWTPEEQLEMRRYRAMLNGEAPAIQPEGGRGPGAVWREQNK